MAAHAASCKLQFAQDAKNKVRFIGLDERQNSWPERIDRRSPLISIWRAFSRCSSFLAAKLQLIMVDSYVFSENGNWAVVRCGMPCRSIASLGFCRQIGREQKKNIYKASFGVLDCVLNCSCYWLPIYSILAFCSTKKSITLSLFII